MHDVTHLVCPDCGTRQTDSDRFEQLNMERNEYAAGRVGLGGNAPAEMRHEVLELELIRNRRVACTRAPHGEEQMADLLPGAPKPKPAPRRDRPPTLFDIAIDPNHPQAAELPRLRRELAALNAKPSRAARRKASQKRAKAPAPAPEVVQPAKVVATVDEPKAAKVTEVDAAKERAELQVVAGDQPIFNIAPDAPVPMTDRELREVQAAQTRKAEAEQDRAAALAVKREQQRVNEEKADAKA